MKPLTFFKSYFLLIACSQWFMFACDTETSFHGIPADKDLNVVPQQDLDQKFAVADIENASVVIHKEAGSMEQGFALAASITHALSYTQTQRDPDKETFKQGKDGAAVQQDFTIQDAGLLDLLIVMDNSGTMQTYQNMIAPRMNSLLTHVGNTNWTIRVVTTDNSCPVDTITAAEYASDKAGAEMRFANAINIGTNGSPTERGIEMAIKGLNGECSRGNRPWLRDNSTSAVLIITDEANCGSSISDNCTTPPMQHYGPAEFANMTRAGTKVYGLLYKNNPCDYDGYPVDEIHYPNDYYDLVAQTNGIWDPICQNDYSNTLVKISADVSNIVKHEFNLDHVPDANTLMVKLDGAILNAGYTLNGQLLTFDKSVVNNGRMISVNYSYNAVPRHMSFTLAGNPAPSTLEVKLNGSGVPKNQYQYNPGMKTLNFTAMPPDDATIDVDYLKDDKQLNTDFDIPSDALDHTIVAKINGQRSMGFDFDARAQKLKFHAPPGDGAQIAIEFNKAGELVTEYVVDTIANMLVYRFEVMDSDTQEILRAELRETTLVFDEDDVFPGRNIQAKFFSKEELPKQISLAFDPLPETMKVTVSNNDSECLAGVTLNGKDLTINCDKDEVEAIRVDYDYVNAFHTSFKVKGVVKANAIWHVWVDGNELEDFEVDGSTVHIASDLLKTDSTVRVKVKDRFAE